MQGSVGSSVIGGITQIIMIHQDRGRLITGWFAAQPYLMVHGYEFVLC